MRFKNYVNQITRALENYKKEIDSLVGMYQSEKAKLQQEVTEMQKTHLPEYIAEYKANWRPKANYRHLMDTARAKAEPVVTHYLAALERSIRGYFGAPVRSDFANKIMSIQITGLKLTDAEFEILKASANSYMEYAF